MKTILALLFLFYSFPDFAGCENVQTIRAGAASPCDGWLVKDSQMQSFAKSDEELKIQRQLNEVNKQLITLSEAEISFYKKRSLSQSAELEKTETRRWLSTVGAFALGVVLTGVAAKAAIESTK